jgi:tetratricopeptide (TPR) repeat protein
LQRKTLVVRQWTWQLALPQMAVQGLLIAGSMLFFWQQYRFLSIAFGAVAYLIYSYGSRSLLLRHHRLGRVLSDQGNYRDAIIAFEKSYQFFSKNVWLDEYRYLTMMTPAQQTFREMALVNIAYCYIQLGDKEQAEAYYRRALTEYPTSTMAQTGLDAIETMTDSN